jgi:hypothetical protein
MALTTCTVEAEIKAPAAGGSARATSETRTLVRTSLAIAAEPTVLSHCGGADEGWRGSDRSSGLGRDRGFDPSFDRPFGSRYEGYWPYDYGSRTSLSRLFHLLSSMRFMGC